GHRLLRRSNDRERHSPAIAAVRTGDEGASRPTERRHPIGSEGQARDRPRARPILFLLFLPRLPTLLHSVHILS
ncbi:hypothetical protein PENTCL1PPCAC_20775, partial [Pristionchus entomophagus]